MRPDDHAIYGLLSGVNHDERPKIYYFGQTANATVCQEKCGMEKGCYAFAFGLAKMEPTWRYQCHGRDFGAPETLVNQATYYTSGVKLC